MATSVADRPPRVSTLGFLDLERGVSPMATMREKPGVWEVRVFTGTDARGTPTQTSRTVRGTKRDAERLAASLEVGAGSASPASRKVSDACIDHNLDTWAPVSHRLVVDAGSYELGHRHDVAPPRSPTLVGHRLDRPRPRCADVRWPAWSLEPGDDTARRRPLICCCRPSARRRPG